MPRILSDALNSGVAGVQISENVNNFQLGNVAGGFTNFNGGLNESVADGTGELFNRLVVNGKVECFEKMITPLKLGFWEQAIPAPSLGKAVNRNVNIYTQSAS